MKIGLALGGGSAKGLAHIGVIQVLEKEKIPIDLICGTSIGAIIGAVYSLNPDAAMLRSKAKEVISSETFKNIGFRIFCDRDYNLFEKITTFIKEKFSYSKILFRPAIIEREKLYKLLEEIFDDRRFDDAKIPIAVVSIDIVMGKDIILKSGYLLPAISASIAIPGLFPYVEKEGCLLVDGGSTQNVPIKALKEMGADVVIASNLSSPPRPRTTFKTGLDINFRVDEIVKYRLLKKELSEADVVISPNVKDVHWADYKRIDFCIKKGVEATIQALPQIRAKMRKPLIYRLMDVFRR